MNIEYTNIQYIELKMEMIPRDSNGLLYTKYFPVVEERKARWKPFGRAKDGNNMEYTHIGEEVKLVLRYPKGNYKRENMEEQIERNIDDSIKKITKKERKIVEVEPEPEQQGKYRPPSRQVDSSITQKLEEQKLKCNIVITNLHNVKHDEIMCLFAKYGRINKIHTITEDNSDYVKLAFVHYETPEQAQKAIDNCHRRPINSAIVHVEIAKPRK